MKVEFTYMYRDASNHKRYNTVYLEGDMPDGIDSAAQYEKAIFDETDGGNFIATQVGLDTVFLFDSDPMEDDHWWHEVFSIEETDEVPFAECSPKEMLERFRKANKAGWNPGVEKVAHDIDNGADIVYVDGKPFLLKVEA